jgi:hypothetical protein
LFSYSRPSSPDEIQSLSYALCHNFARAMRTVSIPAPVFCTEPSFSSHFVRSLLSCELQTQILSALVQSRVTHQTPGLTSPRRLQQRQMNKSRYSGMSSSLFVRTWCVSLSSGQRIGGRDRCASIGKENVLCVRPGALLVQIRYRNMIHDLLVNGIESVICTPRSQSSCCPLSCKYA